MRSIGSEEAKLLSEKAPLETKGSQTWEEAVSKPVNAPPAGSLLPQGQVH